MPSSVAWRRSSRRVDLCPATDRNHPFGRTLGPMRRVLACVRFSHNGMPVRARPHRDHTATTLSPKHDQRACPEVPTPQAVGTEGFDLRPLDPSSALPIFSSPGLADRPHRNRSFLVSGVSPSQRLSHRTSPYSTTTLAIGQTKAGRRAAGPTRVINPPDTAACTARRSSPQGAGLGDVGSAGNARILHCLR
jgi:hypothetical protein